MKIERLKSILLIILVISSIILTANKWFSEELWPSGYNFFSNVKSRISGEGKDGEKGFNPNEEILKPAEIIVNNLSNHVLYTKSSLEYDEICDEIKKMLYIAFTSKKSIDTDDEEWNNQLKSKSCYFSYPVIYDASYFASQLSLGYEGSIKYIKEFIVSGDLRIPSVMHMYIKDAKTEEISKVTIDFESENIASLINNAKNYNGDINYYSFELNFDNTNESSIKDHVIIDRGVLINISPKMLKKLSEQNMFENIIYNEELYKDILSLFEYNTSSIRKYVESDNSMVFVENYGTLKLHSTGLLEYKSTDKTKGIELDNSSVNSCINSCITFVNDVTGLMNTGKSMYFEISSDIHDIQSRSFTLSFDYYINDSKIIIPEDRYQTKNAITVEVENGTVVSYTQVFNKFSPLSDEIGCGSAIDAIDRLETGSADISGSITDIFAAYSYNKDLSDWVALWCIEDSKGNISTISPKAEVQ